MFKNLIRLRSDPTEFQCIFFSFMQLVHFLSDKKHISTAMHETVFKQLLVHFEKLRTLKSIC